MNDLEKGKEFLASAERMMNKYTLSADRDGLHKVAMTLLVHAGVYFLADIAESLRDIVITHNVETVVKRKEGSRNDETT